MVNSTEIRVYMTRENENNKSLAEKVGISSATLGRWLEKQDMPVSYAEKIAIALHIPQPEWPAIFFCPDVASQATSGGQNA